MPSVAALVENTDQNNKAGVSRGSAFESWSSLAVSVRAKRWLRVEERMRSSLFEGSDSNISGVIRTRYCSFAAVHPPCVCMRPERCQRGATLRAFLSLFCLLRSLCELVVKSEADVLTLIEQGGAVRKVASTNMNERSSRSHSCFTIKVCVDDNACHAYHNRRVPVDVVTRYACSRQTAREGGWSEIGWEGRFEARKCQLTFAEVVGGLPRVPLKFTYKTARRYTPSSTCKLGQSAASR